MAKPIQKPAGRPIAIPLYGPLTWRNAMSWAILIVGVLIIRWVWFEPYTIPSGSMEPTLHGDPRILRGDRVFIDKIRFGLRVPFMDARFIKGKPPERWDIVVFHSPNPTAEHPILIKRVVGLPGERIHVGEDGNIYANGKAVEPPESLKSVLHYVQRLTPGDAETKKWILQNIQALIPPENVVIASDDVDEAKTHIERLKKIQERLRTYTSATINENEIVAIANILTDKDIQLIKTRPDYKMFAEERSREIHSNAPFRYGILPDDEFSLVPAGHYLVMGDNSNNSLDGRFFGWVPEDNIYGRAFCIWWPLARMRDFTGFSAQWYGIFFVYILPLVVFVWMFSHRFILRTCRIHEQAIGGTFNVGERLVVDCLAYGLRTPLIRPKAFIKPPQKNDIVLCYAPQSEVDTERRMVLGYVAAVPGDTDSRAAKKLASGSYLIACDDSDGGAGAWSQFVVEHGDLVGRVVSVCWPIAKRRKVTAVEPAKLETPSSK